MPLKEAALLQATLVACSRMAALDWIERHAARFRSLVETDEAFRRLVRLDPAAAQRLLEIH